MMTVRFTYQQYIDDVLASRVVVCKWVRLAVERHIDDLAHGAERGIYFDGRRAQRVIRFFLFLRHVDGEFVGQPVVLQPWQQFVLAMVFGWRRIDNGYRRFRTVYLSVARKNGKSTMIGGVGLYLLDADNEPSARVYAVATKKDQALEIWEGALKLMQKSPALKKRIRHYKHKTSLVVESTMSKFVPLGRDSSTMDGLNVHGWLVDELHAHRTRDMWDIGRGGTGTRRQPLTIAITTRGVNARGICYSIDSYVCSLLDGTAHNDAFFGVIYTLDEGDDWENENVWVKANPGLGVNVSLTDMQDKAREATAMPEALSTFLTKHCNLWTQSENRWVNITKWKDGAVPVDPVALLGRPCYGALDLSSNLDITAFVLVFPPQEDGDLWIVLPHFWIPADNIQDRVKRDRVEYDVWVRAGFLHATPGDTIDHAYVLAEIERLHTLYDIREIAFDRWGASQVVLRLQGMGLEVVEHGQGFAGMAPAMRELERLIWGGMMAHGGHPVLTWMAGNLVVARDPAGNLKPDRDKSREKIDGMVALAMAVGRAVRHGAAEADAGSVYDTRGVQGM